MEPKKKEQTHICRIREVLFQRIQNGLYPDGRKLPGSSKLAAEFGVARGTVEAAVELLVQDRYLERLARSGTYVLKRPQRILYVWNSAQTDFDPVHFNEDMAINQLLLHGLFQESQKLDMRIASEYIPARKAEEWDGWFRHRFLKEFDGLIIRGAELSFFQIQEKYAVPCAKWNSRFSPRAGISSVTDEQTELFEKLLMRAKEKKYTRLVIVQSQTWRGFAGRSNAAKHRNVCRIAGEMGFSGIERYPVSRIDGAFLEKLTPQDAVYCAHTDLIPQLYALCREKNIVPGRDFGLFGYGSGMTLSNLYPEVTLGRIDFCGIGRELCRCLRHQILTGETTNTFVPGYFQEGASL